MSLFLQLYNSAEWETLSLFLPFHQLCEDWPETGILALLFGSPWWRDPQYSLVFGGTMKKRQECGP